MGVKAGDRALETARKIHQKCVMEAPDELWLDVPKAAALIQSAMNAQERELDQLLPDSLNRPMSERIQGLKARADREANLAVELRDKISDNIAQLRTFLTNMRRDASDAEDPELAEYANAIDQHLDDIQVEAERGGTL